MVCKPNPISNTKFETQIAFKTVPQSSPMETSISSSNVSFARQAAEIQELRDAIRESADSLEKHASITLACLLCTSRVFFFSAVRVLWGTRKIKTEDLLTLLPGVTKKHPGPRFPSWAITIESDIPNPLPKHYFNRFNLYAPFVKHLEFRLAGYTHTLQQGLSATRSYAQARMLLPNLVSLSAKGGRFYLWQHLTA
ncbi:hypothetical protein FS749_013535 [Ceratobasidium sp. UAMH 11750]|nr:hypothetical protein FS749_013535 [Ceratobasidium sp. UAMH 11750]